MQLINLNQILQDTFQAIRPAALLRGIHLSYSEMGTALYTNLPMDKVIPPVLTLVLRLIYIFPEGREIHISTHQKYDDDKKSYFLRIEIKVKRISFNPNLLFKSDNNRFVLEDKGENHVIAIEWQTEETPQAEEPKPINGVAEKGISDRIESRIYNESVVTRFQTIGQNVFVQEKLKATKSRKETDFLDAVHAIISKNLDKSDFTAENLERELCISKTQLFRRLKDLTNHSTSNYIRHFRLQKAAELLGTTVLPIGDIAERVGFRELTYFSSSFSDEFHLTPKEWRKMKQ